MMQYILWECVIICYFFLTQNHEEEITGAMHLQRYKTVRRCKIVGKDDETLKYFALLLSSFLL